MITRLEKIAEILKTYKSFSIYSHIHTDLDAIGSSLALKLALESIGKTAHVFIDSELPANSRHLKNVELINNQKQSEYDVAIVLDLSDESRLGRLKFKYRKNVKTTICIDHHLDPFDFCRFTYVNQNVSSTCENVYNLLKILGIKIDKEMCRCILSGMVTDSGCFKFSCAYPSSFRVAGELLEKSGFAMDEITNPLYNSKSFNEYELWKLSISKTELLFGNKAAIITLTQENFKNTGTSMKDTKGLYDNAMILESVQIVVLASQDSDGVYYLTIRTKTPYSAKNIAEDFGGGGHLKAAGCKIPKPIGEMRTLICESLKKELERK